MLTKLEAAAREDVMMCSWLIIFSAKGCIQFTLGVVKDLLKVAEVDHVTKTKVILYQSIQDIVQLTLVVFPVYIHQPGE